MGLPFLFLSLLISPTIRGQSPREIQEVRLAKARLLLADGHEEKALKTAYKNVAKGTLLHQDSFRFILEHYLRKGEIPKGERFFRALLKTHALEGEEALGLHQEAGLAYLQVYWEEEERKLLELAREHLTLCLEKGHDLPYTTLYLGRVALGERSPVEALRLFRQAKELLREKSSPTSPSRQKEIDYLMAQALVQSGHFDSASLYFSSILSSPESPKSLRNVANEYLRALDDNFFSLNGGFSLKHTNNAHELSARQLSNYGLIQEFYGPKGGLVESYSVTGIGNVRRMTNNWGSLFLLHFTEESYREKKQRDLDTRSLSFVSKIKYHGLDNSLFRLKYYLTKSYHRPYAEGPYSPYALGHTLEPVYIHNLESGAMGYHLWGGVNDYEGGRRGNSLGAGLSFTPFFAPALLRPSYSFKYLRRRQKDGSDTDIYDISLTYTLALTESFSLFPTLSFKKSSNDQEAYYDYLGFQAMGSLSYRPRWKFARGLSFSGGVDYTREKREETAERMSLTAVYLGVNYSI